MNITRIVNSKAISVIGLMRGMNFVSYHIITRYFAVPLMIQTSGGLIIEMIDGVGDELREWNFYYDLEKALNIRLARSLLSSCASNGSLWWR